MRAAVRWLREGCTNDPGEPKPDGIEGDADEPAGAAGGEEEEEDAAAKEARCRREDQCMKNAGCVRGFKHGPGPCRIRK